MVSIIHACQFGVQSTLYAWKLAANVPLKNICFAVWLLIWLIFWPLYDVPSGDGANERASWVVTVGDVGDAVKTVAWNSSPYGPLTKPTSISFQDGSG